MGREMGQKFHAFMFPWFAFGHMTPYVHLANKLAEKGHRVTFLLPKKAKKQLEHLNLFPDSIVFHPITIPHVDGLPAGAETPSDIPVTLWRFLSTAMDLTRDQVEAAVRALRPDIILFDLAYWITEVAKEHGIKSMLYNVISATSIAHDLVPGGELGVPPPGYPSSTLLFRRHDAHALLSFAVYYKRFYYRVTTGLTNCDFISIRTCKEIEGKFCDYIGRQYQKKVLLTGPMLPEPDKSKPLEDKWNNLLSGFEPGSVVYCALGSQITLEKDQFQELCLGLELTGLPFFVAVTPPKGAKTIQEALPEDFEERVKGRGVVWGEWVQQPLILAHPSVGCFVSHCGFGSMWESLMSDCQIVLLPYLADQVLNTRLLTDELEVSVEVPREKTGWFSKENLRAAVTSVMDKDSDIGNLVRRNHSKLKEVVVSPGLLTGYTDNFVVTLENLLKETNLA
ncbi:PREDICTED: UDP-glycosyltransferase 79B9 [Brassica oleracea var. oleracea]|uniref:Glycosyltransferase n=2 Tax=Brassica TaxID=3705 RepID=A0A0D3AMB0_BRAOL|nr:PREDICTED: UDP-glycosyltransferase 79B9 [Brassica oleracea var. oleracea]